MAVFSPTLAATLPTLIIPPDGPPYTVDGGMEVDSTKLKGGLSRFRRDQLGASSTVTMEWTCDAIRYQYMRSFYRGAVAMGSLPFNMNLIFDGPDFEPYVCYFLSNFQLKRVAGLSRTIAATLEIVPLYDADPDFDSGFVALYSSYGDESADMLAALAALVNTYFPTV